MNSELLTNILHSYHLRVTDTRLQVLDVLINSETALCHHEIAKALQKYFIDKVTLYRTLNTFEERGLIHKVANKDRIWQYAIYIKNSDKAEINRSHAHFVCDKCERIYCMPIAGSDTLPDIQCPGDFIVKEKELRLHGLCPECRNHKKMKNRTYGKH